jgi:CheY-like chemotaxis protein
MSATLIDVTLSRVRRASNRLAKAPPRLHGRILVAADSSDGRKIISSILGCMGLDVVVVENGRDAFRSALAAWKGGAPFDVVLIDTTMPEIDGYEATGLLRSVGYPGRIVAMVSCGFHETHARCIAAGCDGYASKPVSYRMLRDAMERHLSASPGNSAGAASKQSF